MNEMTGYPPEDFKNARFAEHPDGAKAVRWEMNYRVPWHTATGDRFSDEQMAENGWRPVVEARILEHTLRDLRDDLAVARKERDRLAQDLRRSYGLPKGDGAISLDGLRAAWESAEVPTDDIPIRKGDLCGVFMSGTWIIGEVGEQWSPDPRSDARILHRAPRREPWEDLADVLAVEMPGIEDEPRIEALAKALHCEHGVRVTGGDDA